MQANGRLSWAGVPLSWNDGPAAPSIPVVTRDDLLHPALGLLLAAFCTIGLMVTIRYSLAAMALLPLLTLLHPKVREDYNFKRMALLAASAGCCLSVWMLVTVLPEPPLENLTAYIPHTLGVTFLFCAGLWSSGVLVRNAARHYSDQLGLHHGLYGLGVGAQILSGLVALMVIISLSVWILASSL